MPVRNIKINKYTKFIFALLIVLSVGVCLAFTSLGSNLVASAEGAVTESVGQDAEIDYFSDEIETGASINLLDTATMSSYAPDPAIAVAEARESAVITLSGDLWTAIQSGRITATLYASGTNTYETITGTASTKDAGYTVSGAMTGSGKFSNANTTYEDREIAPATLLDAENGNQIIIEYYATHTAIDSKTTLGENLAESKVECQMTFTLKLDFEEVIFTINSSAGGSVKDGSGDVLDLTLGEKTITLGFNDAITFTALPSDRYYFIGWKKVGTTESNVTGMTLNLGKAVEIPSGQKPSYSAQFQYITVVTQDEYIYSGSPQGPVVRSTAYTGVYYLTHSYTGTTLSGESVEYKSEGAENIVSGPTRAGSFNYTCEFYYRVGTADGFTKGEKIGGLSIDFDIHKNTPIVTRGGDGADTITLSFGDNLGDLDLSYSATNSVDTLVLLYGVLEVYLGEEKIDVNKLLPISNDGTDYTLRFTPNDLDNYNVLDSNLKIYVKDDIKDSGTNIEEGNRSYTITKVIATAEDVEEGIPTNFASLTVPDGGELVKISLRATMNDESGQYFFIGWRICFPREDSSSYDYSYLSAGKVNRDASGEISSIDGLAYDYYLPHYSVYADSAEKDRYTHAEFQAIFVRDTTCGTSADTLTIPYSGSATYTTPTFNPQRAYYDFGYGKLMYYHESNPTVGVTDIPYAIGTHYLKYDIINHAVDDTVVDTRVIKYDITLGILKATIDEDASEAYGGYDKSIGWARQMHYSLSVEGLLSGGAEAYLYSTDNGATWTQIDGTISSVSGCPLSFITPEVVNDTKVVSYVFMATHETNGKPMVFGDKTYNVVAGIDRHVIAKLDTVEPSLTDLVETSGFNGAWTLLDVAFSGLVTFGGSGAVIDVCYKNNSSSYVKVDSNISLSMGETETKTENETVNFKISTQYSGDIKVRIRTGSGLVYEVDTLYPVNIDHASPVFGPPEKDHVPNTSQGWIGETTKFTFEIHNEGGAPLIAPTAVSELGESVAVELNTSGKYSIEISNSLSYTITARDEAGNVSLLTIQEKIDVENVIYSYDESSYFAGNWAKEGSKIVLNLSMGGSGARLRCSVDGSDYQPVTDYVGEAFGQISTNFKVEYELPYSDEVLTYNFQIETGTGELIDVEFGEVRFDIEAPVYTLLTDLSYYQGARWTSSVITAEFTAFDNQGVINSGIPEDGVSVDNGGVIAKLGNGKYRLTIDKCTNFTVTIKDNAGNTIYAVIQANVDTVDPELELKAYVGGGNPEDVEEAPTDEENSDANLYDFSSWITKANPEPWIRLEFTINLTASGSRLEYSNNNGVSWESLTPTYTPAVGEVSGTEYARAYITVEQNRKYQFRLATGSGKYVLYEAPGSVETYIKLDFTAPTLRSEAFRVENNANFDLKNVWVNKDGQYRVILQDTLTGSGVDTSNVVLREYALDEEDDNILNGTATFVERAMTASGDYFVFDMTEAKKYLLYFKDLAGNAYEGDIFIPHIDKTDGFKLTLSAYKGAENGSVIPLDESAWLGATDYAIFEGTPVFQSGTTGFGPSGGEMQFSIDGGATYHTLTTINGEIVSVEYIDTLGVYQVVTTKEQVYTYKFRLVTGAGVEYVCEKEYTVQKDNTTPTVESALKYVDGTVYSGEWTNKDLRFTINVLVGASGGTLYCGNGESRDTASWTELIDLPKNVGQASVYYYTLNSSTSGNYYFRVVSGRENITAEDASEHAVKLDNTAIEVGAQAVVTATSTSVESGSWVPSETNLSPVINTIGASGIYKVYVKNNLGSGYGEYTEVTADGYEINVVENTYALIGYIFKVVSISGMEAESEEFIIGYDDVSPTFTYNVTGNKLPSGNLYEDWYVTEISVDIMIAKDVPSGYQAYYQEKANEEGASYSEWKAVDNTFTLTDNCVQGGKDSYYRFMVVTGSGLNIVTEEVYLPIDTFSYSVSATLYVGETQSSNEYRFAEVSGEGSYKRGDSVTLVITSNAGYTIKSINEKVGESENLLFDLTYEESSSDEESRVYTIGKDCIALDVNFYKEITIKYVDRVEEIQPLRQCLQNKMMIEVPIEAEEDGFENFFGDLFTIVNRTYEKEDVSYTQASDITEIGEYQVNVESLNENFVVTNPTCPMIVVYFAGEGNEENPYPVKTIEDFYYIDEYMHLGTGSDALLERAYLGENRFKACFKQVGDIILPMNFKPNGDKGADYTNEFKGSYDGDGYEIIYNGTFVTEGDFGLFLNISDDAKIMNLGVRYSVRTNNASGTNIGLVVANAKKGGITHVYAIGNVYVSGTDVNVGGIAGSITEGSLISHSFVDATISVTNASGYFGGIVGYANASYPANVYSVSRITLVACEKYSATAEAGAEFAYAGAIIGYMENLEGAGETPKENNKSYYLDANLSYDGSIEQGLSLGNQDTFGRVNELQHASANIDFFASNQEGSASNVKIIDVDRREATVRELVNVRIEEIKASANLQGSGTTESPFLVDSQEKLAFVETFPWAVFEQTCDVMVDRVFAENVPFVGVYNGGGYAITGANVESDAKVYGGLFGVVSGTITNLKVIDFKFVYGGSGEGYLGGLVGVLKGGTISNVVVSGTVEVESQANLIYAGGVVGIMIGGTLNDVISIVNVSVNGVNVVVGGVIAEGQGEINVQNVVNLSSISAHYEEKANIGATLGAVNNEGARLWGLYHLLQNAYANDKSISTAIGYNLSIQSENVSAKTYQAIMESTIGGNTVQDTIGALYPFNGNGTKASPFEIDSYEKLELVGNYMYANFILTDNIVIGDLNDDGKLDSADGYNYDFEVIGKGAVFTGSLDGDGHSIIGLSDSLFAVNAGAVSDITLNVDYKVYANASDIPASDKVIDGVSGEEYTSSKVAKAGEDIIFGALARVNTATGSLIRVIVTGEVYVRTKGNSKVVVGGLVGVDMGGQMVASQIGTKISIRASQVVAGGIVGEIEYSDRALNQITTNYVIVNDGIDVGGGVVIAGSFIGRLGVTTTYEPDYATSTEVIVNGVTQGNDCYVGLSK